MIEMLAPTPADKLVDARGRPYFLWDEDLDLATFVDRLTGHADPDVRDYYLGKLLRQAKPDDALTFVTAQAIVDAWPRIERYLGARRDFWAWLLERWAQMGRVHR